QVQVTVEPFGAPRIDRFVANPGLVNKGETVKLEWKVRAAESLEIVSELGNRIAMFVPAPAEGSYEVRPTDTSKYVLRARNGMGQDSKEAEVIVAVRPKVSLALDKKEVRHGEEVTLSWTVADAETLAIFDPTGEVVFEGPASNGSTTVEANRTGSYRAIAIGMGGEEQVEVRVEVEPLIDEFKVEAQGSARPGACALASWKVRGAERVVLSNGVADLLTSYELEKAESVRMGIGGAFILRAYSGSKVMEAQTRVEV